MLGLGKARVVHACPVCCEPLEPLTPEEGGVFSFEHTNGVVCIAPSLRLSDFLMPEYLTPLEIAYR